MLAPVACFVASRGEEVGVSLSCVPNWEVGMGIIRRPAGVFLGRPLSTRPPYYKDCNCRARRCLTRLPEDKKERGFETSKRTDERTSAEEQRHERKGRKLLTDG